MKKDDIIQHIERMISHRQGYWDTYWQEIADYVLPKNAEIIVENIGGQSKTKKIYDNTAVMANENFASSLHGMLINYSAPWFQLESDSDQLNNNQDARAWFDAVTKIVHDLVHEPSAGFSTAMDELFLELGAFGTSCLAVKYDPDSIVKFDVWRAGCYAIAEDSTGRVNRIAGKYKKTVSQIKEMFNQPGDNIPETVNKHYVKDPNKEMDLYYYVAPRLKYKTGKGVLREDKKFAEYWIDCESKEIIREGGYDRFPYKVVRWRKDAGEVYGYSPAMTAKNDIKTLNAAVELQMKASELGLQPPLDVPHDGYYGTIKLFPGALNYRKPLMGQEGIRPIVELNGVQVNQEMIMSLKDAVRRAFYSDNLTMKDQPNMTATEINQRASEMLRFAMPMLGRVKTELINEAITDAYFIASSVNLFPPLPKVLENTSLNIRYKSQLAMAQANAETEKILNTLRIVGELIPLDESVQDPYNIKKAGTLIANNLGYPVEGMRDEEEQAQIAAQRQQARQQAQQAQAAMTQAEVMNKAAPAMQAQQGAQ